MRAVQITRFGGPEVLDVVDLPDPVPGDGEQLYDVSAAGINFADTHQALSRKKGSASFRHGPLRTRSSSGARVAPRSPAG